MRDHKTPLPPISYLDPGWFFLLSGLAVIIATIMIPAVRELDDVRHQRDRALAVEQHRLDRLQRYGEYLAALERQDPSLVIALAASQLNKIPEGRSAILETSESSLLTASVFAALEPPPPQMPRRTHPDSLLYRWTTSERTRPWLLAAGGICMLMGLMTRSSASARMESPA